MKQLKCSTVAILAIGLFFFCPYLLVSGQAERSTKRDRVNGSTCYLRLAGTPDGPVRSSERIKFFSDKLKKVDRDWKQVGFILEELLRIHLKESKYPARDFDVRSSLQYFGEGRTLGELDLVIVRRSNGRVVEVGQVKFSGRPRNTIGKAMEQIVRFKKALKDQRVERLKWSDGRDMPPSIEAFTSATRHVTYGSRGSCNAGFDYELDIGREEGDSVQEILLGRKKSPAR